MTDDRESLLRIDITDPAFKADPFGLYTRLRAEAPVLRVDVPRFGHAYLITRYDDVTAALRDPRLLKNPRWASAPGPRIPAALAPLRRNLLGLDGTDHDRLRRLVHTAFTPRRVEAMREQAAALADELLDTALGRGDRFDLVADYALPLPLTLIARILGVPERDKARFHTWTRTLLSMADGNPLFRIPSVLRFLRYLRRLIAERSVRPADDLVSALVAARDADERLTADEILAMVVLLLTAGHETTVNLIGTGGWALLRHPDQLALLRDRVDDPGLVASAVEELVRYVAPAETATERYATEDVVVAGTRIPRGSLVLAVIASANRDPTRFTDPDTLDLTRHPNRHLSFGHGAHYCLGASLARLEASVALPRLVRRVPDLRLCAPSGPLRWRGGLVLRGIEALPVATR